MRLTSHGFDHYWVQMDRSKKMPRTGRGKDATRMAMCHSETPWEGFRKQHKTFPCCEEGPIPHFRYGSHKNRPAHSTHSSPSASSSRRYPCLINQSRAMSAIDSSRAMSFSKAKRSKAPSIYGASFISSLHRRQLTCLKQDRGWSVFAKHSIRTTAPGHHASIMPGH